MHLVYLDDSHDTPYYIFAAIVVPAQRWANTFAAIRAWRQALRASDGILVTRELHATEFCGGRGRIASSVVAKGRRCQIFRDALSFLSSIPDVALLSCRMKDKLMAYERLMNRVNRFMQANDTYAVLISDEGNEAEYTRLTRRMSVHNPIPSRFGYWLDTGKATKNIPLDRLLDDPFFRDSKRSYFVQMADFCAYALLRREVQLPSKNKYGLHTAFELLEPICVKQANPRDPLGIIGSK